MKKVELLTIPVNTGTYNEFIADIINSALARERKYTCVANVHTLVEAYSDNNFAKVINQANLVTPDGKPLAWAMRILYGIKQVRVAGMDLLPDLLNSCSEQNIPVFFYGGSAGILEKTKFFLKEHYPSLTVSGFYSPPFRNLTKSEQDFVVRSINNSGAALIFVVLGCPKQERWMNAVKDRINAVTVGVGGALPVLIGINKRAPKWMQHNGLEWFFRFLQEPYRLFRRYAVTNSLFVVLLVKQYLKIKLSMGEA